MIHREKMCKDNMVTGPLLGEEHSGVAAVLVRRPVDKNARNKRPSCFFSSEVVLGLVVVIILPDC